MAKSLIFTALIYITIGIILVLFLSSSNHPHSRHRRLKLRQPSSDHHHDHHHHRPPIPFDPIISHIERKREDRQWEKAHFHFDDDDAAPAEEAQPLWEDFMDAEDYINDEERFNVTNRIELLFPKIDVAPADGFASAEELAEWNYQIAFREVMHRTARDMEVHDKNKDGFVSVGEYEPPSWLPRDEDNTSSSPNVGWWKGDHFNASDVDGNGLLNITEFNDFLHPADSTNPKLIQWLCKEEIRERDVDKDGKLNFEEFFHGLYDSIRNYDEVHNDSDTSETAPAKKMFRDLDKDSNGFLSEDEMRTVIGNLHPSEHYYAKQQADYALSQADTDKDGRLTLTEMIEHPYVFYSSIFNDDDDDDDFHDEFR